MPHRLQSREGSSVRKTERHFAEDGNSLLPNKK